jgi:hypothetical protein
MKKFIFSMILVLGLLLSGTANAANKPVIQNNNSERIVSNPEPEFIPVVLCYHKTTTTTSPDGTTTTSKTTICLVVIL